MINFKNNKTLLTFFIALVCAGTSGLWAMGLKYKCDLTIPDDMMKQDAIKRDFAQAIFDNLHKDGDNETTDITLKVGEQIVGHVHYFHTKVQDKQKYIFVLNYEDNLPESRTQSKKHQFETKGMDGAITIENIMSYFNSPKEGDYFKKLKSVLPQVEYRKQQVDDLPKSFFSNSVIDRALSRSGKTGTDIKSAINLIILNKIEFFTALGRLAAIEFNQCCSDKKTNNKKALFVNILIDAFRVLNDGAALWNQKYTNDVTYKGTVTVRTEYHSLLDDSTILFMIVDLFSVLVKTKTLFGAQNSKHEQGITDSKNDVKINKIRKIVTGLSRLVPHIEGLAAVARSLTKVRKFESTTFVQICTLFICMTRVAEYCLKMADSESKIIKTVPYVILATVCLAVCGDLYYKNGMFFEDED